MTNQLFGKVQGPSLKRDTKVVDKKVYGLNFPLGGNRGYFSKQSGVTLIKNNLTQLLRTSRGERVMLPSFGAELKKFLFEPLDESLFEQLRSEILGTITSYLPQVEVIKLTVVSLEETGIIGFPGFKVTIICQIINEDQLIEVDLNII